MRVTQSMMSADLLKQLSNSYGQLSTLQQQLSSGKKITRPSQDPVVAVMGLSYRTDVNHVDQFQRNVSEAYKWTDSSDSSLDQMNSVMQRMRELTVQASNGTNTPDDLKSINDEVDQLKQQLVQVGNTQVAGKYLFNGQRTGQPPLKLLQPGDPGNTTGISQVQLTFTGAPASQNDYKLEVSDGVQLAVNVNPTTVFKPDLFKDITDLQAKLTSGASGEDIGKSITAIDSHLDEINAARSDLGARVNRMDMLSNRLDQQKEISTKIMSTNEDADFETTLVKFNQQQTVHQAALSVGAKIIQPTLVDFLR